jgi:carbon storage regulator
MLVLSRKEDESIVIDGRIKVTVVRIQGHQIRLGIEAPAEVGVLRSELLASAPVVVGPFTVPGRELLASTP